MFYNVFSVNVSLLSAAVVAAATGCPLFAAALLLIAAAVVGRQAAYFYCGLRCTIAAPLQRLPLAAPLCCNCAADPGQDNSL